MAGTLEYELLNKNLEKRVKKDVNDGTRKKVSSIRRYFSHREGV